MRKIIKRIKDFIKLFKLVRSVKRVVLPITAHKQIKQIGEYLEKKKQFVKENDGSYTHGFIKVIVNDSSYVKIGMLDDINSNLHTVVADIDEINIWINYFKTFKR